MHSIYCISNITVVHVLYKFTYIHTISGTRWDIHGKSWFGSTFSFDSSSGKSVCQVPDLSTEDAEDSSSPTLCGHAIPGKFPSNLRQHLKSHHGAVYQELLRSKEKQKEEREALRSKTTHGPTPMSQRTLGEIVKSQRKYEKESLKYQMITENLAMFVASSSVPNSIIENDEFRSLILTLDPRYQVPSRTLISIEIDHLLLALKGKFQSYLMDAQKVSICADVRTKKGMTTSYLGLTAHFLCRSDLKTLNAKCSIPYLYIIFSVLVIYFIILRNSFQEQSGASSGRAKRASLLVLYTDTYADIIIILDQEVPQLKVFTGLSYSDLVPSHNYSCHQTSYQSEALMIRKYSCTCTMVAKFRPIRLLNRRCINLISCTPTCRCISRYTPTSF